MPKRKRMQWTFHETQDMLKIIKRKHISTLLKKTLKRNSPIFEDISIELAKRGYQKNAEQIRSKYKFMKCAYFKTIRTDGRRAAKECLGQHFDLVDALFTSAPTQLEDEQSTSLSQLYDPEDSNDDLEDDIIQLVTEDDDALSLTDQERSISKSEFLEVKPETLFERKFLAPMETEENEENDGIQMCMKSLAKDIKDADLKHHELMKLKQKLTNVVYDFLIECKSST